MEYLKNMSKKLPSAEKISLLGKLVTRKRVSFTYADAIRMGKGKIIPAS